MIQEEKNQLVKLHMSLITGHFNQVLRILHESKFDKVFYRTAVNHYHTDTYKSAYILCLWLNKAKAPIPEADTESEASATMLQTMHQPDFVSSKNDTFHELPKIENLSDHE